MCLDGLIHVTEIFGKDSQFPGEGSKPVMPQYKSEALPVEHLLKEKEISKLGGFTLMSFLFHFLDWWSRLGSAGKALLMWLQFFWGIGRAAGIWRRRDRCACRRTSHREKRNRQMQVILVCRPITPEPMWWSLQKLQRFTIMQFSCKSQHKNTTANYLHSVKFAK